MHFSSADTLLAIDTATTHCSIALLFTGRVFSRHIEADRSHGAELLPQIDALIEQSGQSLDSFLKTLDGIIVSRGPGSFTGVRIGVAAAQGFAYGINKPLVGVSSLASLACGAIQAARSVSGGYILAALDARMDEIYWALYEVTSDSLKLVLGPHVCGLQEAVQKIHDVCPSPSLIGVGDKLMLDDLNAHLGFTKHIVGGVDASHLISLLVKDADSSILPMSSEDAGVMNVAHGEALEPLYLRNEVAWEKRNRIRPTTATI